MRPTLLVLLALAGGAVGLPAQAPPARKGNHVVVRVTGPDARRPAEVSVAVSPTNPLHVVAAANEGARPGAAAGNSAYASDDGGLTWKTAVVPDIDRRSQGDDVVAFGPDGTAYRACIAFQGIRQPRPLRTNSGIFVSASRDGLAWGPAVPVVDHVNTVEPFEDKPWLAIDTRTGSPHRGNLYVAWTRFDAYGSKDPAHKSHVQFARSRDGGKTFAPGVRISDAAGDCLDSDNTLMGAMPAVGPKGEVYVVWGGPAGVLFDKSADGGFTFGPDKVVVAKPAGGWDIPSSAVGRHNGLPVVGVDPRGGALYVTWIDTRHGDPDVFVTASRDGGATWSESVRVNDDEKGNGAEQLFAWSAVDAADGSVNVIFYDRRGQKDTLTGLTLARSIDGGKTFVNHKVDQPAFALGKGVFFGDYIGVAAQGGRVVAVYSHFVDRRQLALSAAVFRFKPGTQDAAE